MAGWKRLKTAVVAVLALTCASAVVGQPAEGAHPLRAATTAAAAVTPMPLGATSSNWQWYDQAVGPSQIYRNFDSAGFSYNTWQATKAYQLHPNAPYYDYSTEANPKRLLDPNDNLTTRMTAFIATTPKNIIFTNMHEPDNTYPGKFTPAEFRASIVKLTNIVHAQNAIDGGTRRVSVILMGITFGDYGTTTADQWWPTDARDGGHADIIQADLYNLPHATQTTCCPAGYTDGINWRTTPQIIDPLRKFAQARGIEWGISELGFLEDVNNPMRKANAMSSAVAYAEANGSDHVCYFDSSGPRANWKLWWSFPKGTQSMTSNAAVMWKSLVASHW